MAYLAKPKIKIYRPDHEYPVLDIMVTGNTKYLETDNKRVTILTTVDETVDRIREWLLKAVAKETRPNGQRQAKK
jgi:hypothetical protein